MKNMVNLVQKTDEMSEQPEVKVKTKDVIVPAKRVVEASCKANLGQIKNKRALSFQIGEVDVPDGVQYSESIVLLNLRTNHYFKIAVVNDSSRDTIFKKNQRVGCLKYFNSIVPLEVKEIE